MKEHIKKLLEADSTISVSHKTKINQWYSEIKISQHTDEEFGKVYTVNNPYINFYNIDDAVDYFCYNAYTSKNIGYIQNRLNNKGLINEYDVEHPTKKLKEIFKKEGVLIDEEAKLHGITKPKSFPSKEDAIKDIENIMKDININTIGNELKLFMSKYSTIDPYISLGFVYDCYSNGEPYEFTSGFSIPQLTLDNIERAKNQKDIKYKHIRITIKIDDYKYYYI